MILKTISNIKKMIQKFIKNIYIQKVVQISSKIISNIKIKLKIIIYKKKQQRDDKMVDSNNNYKNFNDNIDIIVVIMEF